MKKALISLFVVFALATFASAQFFKPIEENAPKPSKDLGLVEPSVKTNPWSAVVSNNDIGMTYCALLGKHNIGLGPDTAALLGEIQDAVLRTKPENQQWMQSSLRMEKGRIQDTYWRHEITTGGPPVSSKTTTYRVAGHSVQMESGTADKTMSVKVTYLPTMEAKVFSWRVVYSSDNMVGLSYARAFRDYFRSSGLPSFSATTWEQSDPRVRRGLVAVGKLWEKVDKEGIPEVISWMTEVSSK